MLNHSFRSTIFVVALLFSLTLSTTGQSSSVCTTRTLNGGAMGQCKPLRDCAYFMSILTQKIVSNEDKDLLRSNRCRSRSEDVQICCPLEPIKIDTEMPRKTQGLAASTHPLLSNNCGSTKWERSNVKETKIDEYPWLALIESTKANNEKFHACGGVLISARYVLTAAHCISLSQRSNNRISAVRLGEWDTTTNPDCVVTPTKTQCAPPYQDIAVEATLVHPLYDWRNVNQVNDIALIRLKDPAQFSDYVHPICLPKRLLHADELDELVMEVGGWQAQNSAKMEKSEVTIMSIKNCQALYKGHIDIHVSQLCGSARANECLGNYGGPLMLFKDDTYVLGGLLSFGPIPCPQPGWPNVYTRVATYVDWILDTIKV